MRFILTFSIVLLSGNFLPAQTSSPTPNSIHTSLEREEDIMLLHWETPREINTSYFIVERADTGRNFKAITTVKASGYAQFRSEYRFEDETAPHLFCHYRISLVMMDGTRISTEFIAKTKPANSSRTKVLAAE